MVHCDALLVSYLLHCLNNQSEQISLITIAPNREQMIKSRKRSTFTTGVALGGFIGGFIFSAFLFSGLVSVQSPPHLNLNFDAGTTIVIVLTALSLMLTALGIVIAVVGAFGFSLLRVAAANAAAEHADEQLGEDGELRSIIEARVNALVAELQRGRVSDKDFPNPESEYGE